MLAAAVAGAGLPPLTLARAATAWTPQPGVLAGGALLGGGYLAGVRRRPGPWPARRTVVFLLGVVWLVVVGTSAVAVYDDTLFWTRALQGVSLLLVVPMLLAAGAPLTLARDTLPAPAVARLGRVRRSPAARALASPGVATLALVAPPFVIYLTGLYPLELESAAVSGAVSVGLLAAGLLYVVSRLQLDPVPRPTHHGVTLGLAIAEMVADGVLGLVLWTGPLLAAGHVAALDRAWAPDPRDDQAVGAGVWWIGGDLAALPFLGAIATRFAAADAAEARRVDAELDAREAAAAAARGASDGADGGADGDGDRTGADAEPVMSRPWWEDDPRFAPRMRRRA